MVRAPRDSEGGFTLTELLIVLALIAILAAIAVPSFIGAKRNGQDSRAQANVRAGLAAERTYYVDFQEYTTDATALRNIEPNLTYTTTDANQDGVMAAITTDKQVTVVVSTSQSGKQFCIMNIAADLGTAVNGQTAAGTYYQDKTGVTTPPTTVTTGACGTTGYLRTTAAWS